MTVLVLSKVPTAMPRPFPANIWALLSGFLNYADWQLFMRSTDLTVIITSRSLPSAHKSTQEHLKATSVSGSLIYLHIWCFSTAWYGMDRHSSLLGGFPLVTVPGTFFSTTSAEVPSEPYSYQNMTCKLCWSLIGRRKSSLPASLNLRHETQQTR